MAYIIGEANSKEIRRIKSAGYFIEEILTEEREKQIFKHSRKEVDGVAPEDLLVMVYIEHDLVNLLNLENLS
jgi:hypothetical protein